jgi:hypothetical protein
MGMQKKVPLKLQRLRPEKYAESICIKAVTEMETLSLYNYMLVIYSMEPVTAMLSAC